MHKTTRIAVYILAGLIMLTSAASAHQPKVPSEEKAEKSINVDEPEISKAYYSELKGKPHIYIIDSKNEFSLYVGILVPGKNLTHTMSFEISKDGKLIYSGDGASFKWWPYYEKYGRDHYMAGPEFGSNFRSTHRVPPGVYTIKVFNENNSGKYSLAIGDIENFSFTEIVKAVWNVIRLKLFYF